MYKAQKDSKATFSTTGDNNSSQKLKIEKKTSDFFSKFLSHSAEKCKRGDPLGFFEHPFCSKISKIDGGTIKKFREKMKNLNNLTVPKKVGKSHSVEKSRKFQNFIL